VVELPKTNYQTHSADQPGMSDSQKRLERLLLPQDLTGKRVLDIGCNEGFFCSEAVKRGAASVIGIDGHRPFLDIAESKYRDPKIKFLHQRWDKLPEGEFDLVLWTSAMHYEINPAGVLQQISQILAPDGLFILECGVLEWSSKEMVLIVRHDHSLWYPTWPLLATMLSDFGVRWVAKPEITVGDSVPRTVLHCTPRKPIIMLIRGDTRKGKTFLAACISQSATRVVSCDAVVSRIANGKYHHTELEIFIRDHFRDSIYFEIDKAGLTQQYVDLLLKNVTNSDKLVVIEGLITDPQAAALTSKTGEAAIVWDVQRR